MNMVLPQLVPSTETHLPLQRTQKLSKDIPTNEPFQHKNLTTLVMSLPQLAIKTIITVGMRHY
jgi:hypothetical protein